MQDAWRAYLELALGLTEASKKKAMKVAKKLVADSGAKAGAAQAVAEELISTSLANREAVGKLVRYELDRALGRVGLATAEEVAELTDRVQELERRLRAASAAAPVVAAAPEQVRPAGPVPAAAKKAALAKKAAPETVAAPVKKAVKKAVRKTVVAADPQTPVFQEASEQAPVKKAAAKKAVKKVAPKAVAEPGSAA